MAQSIDTETFFSAAVTGDLETLQKLPENENVNIIDLSTGKTALDYAAENQHEHIVQFLLKRNANANLHNECGETPLMLALDNMKIVKMLLNQSTVNAADKEGNSVLMLALNRLEMLAFKRLRIDVAQNAAETQHYNEVAQLLLDAGAEVNTQNSYGDTPLMEAARYADIDTVEKIILKEADVNMQNNVGNTALIEAAVHNRFNIVNLLMRHEADINAQNKAGNTALIEAAQHGQSQMAKLLIKKGADFTIQNNAGETAASLASKNNFIDTARQIGEASQVKIAEQQRKVRGENVYQRRGREYL